MMKMLQQHIGSLFLLTALIIFLMACALQTSTGFSRSKKVEGRNCDSMIQVSFNGKHIAKECYKKNSIFRLAIQNNIKATEYYKDYYGLSELGVDLFTNHCASCHSWYPDFKNQVAYNELDSLKYINTFKYDTVHKTITLSNLELIAIGHYLHILGSKEKNMPSN